MERRTVRPNAPKYSIDLSAVQTPQISTRFLPILIWGVCSATFMKFSSLQFGFLLLLGIVAIGASGCDHGIAPPPEADTGVIRAHITFAQEPDDWPSADSIHDLRFVAMRFVPRDTSDLLQLNRLVFSERLADRVTHQIAVIPNVDTGPFLYAGVAQKFGPDIFNWRPVGLVTENGGLFIVRAGDTTDVSVVADFDAPPPFPPPLP